MSFEEDVRALIELVKKQGASELIEWLTPELHASRQELEAYVETFGRRVPPALRSSLRALNAAIRSAAKKNVKLLDGMESEGVRDYDPSRALLESVESCVQQAKQEAATEAERRYKSRLHTEMEGIRKDLARKGWRKPPTQKEAVTRSILDFLRAHAYITAEQAGGQLGLHDGDVRRAQEVLSRMRREGYVERVRIKDFTGRNVSAYAPTETGRRYDPKGELPQTGKIKDRMDLLTYLQEHEGATKEEIDAVTATASVLFNSVRDGDAKFSKGRYYASQKGTNKFQRMQEHSVDPRATVMQYLMTHGAIDNGKAREITKLSKDKATQVLDGMRAEGVIAYAGTVGNVLADGHRPQIALEGDACTEQVLHYAASLGGTVPVSQVRNLLPGMSGEQRADLIYSLTHAYGGSTSYCERRDGNLVMTQRGYERVGLPVPV